MQIRKIAAAMCSAAMLAGAVSIPAFAEGETELNAFEATAQNVKLLGRSVYTNDVLWFGLTDSGVSFDFTGKHCEIDMGGTNSAFNKTTGARVKVYADGKVVFDECLTTKPTQTINVDFDTEGKHTVKLLKVSECPQNNVTIEEIRVDGSAITPSANGSHTIEFIGDSITCGYGVDGDLKTSFVTSTEDGTKTYAYKTGEYFNADISCVSFSGCGAVSGYTMGENPNTQNLMKDFYDLVGHSWDWFKTTNGTIDANEWEFAYSPELVVINLGTNDYSYTKNTDSKRAEFRAAYKALIEQVREHNPESDILCVLGLMGDELYDEIETTVKEYKTETGDQRIGSCKIDKIDADADGYGSDYHPKEVSHERASKTLINEIKDRYGWSADDPAYVSDSSKRYGTGFAANDSRYWSQDGATVSNGEIIGLGSATTFMSSDSFGTGMYTASIKVEKGSTARFIAGITEGDDFANALFTLTDGSVRVSANTSDQGAFVSPVETTIDPTDGNYHTYGIRLTADGTEWYVDGQKVWTDDKVISGGYMQFVSGESDDVGVYIDWAFFDKDADKPHEHTFMTGNKAATCTEDGGKTQTCIECGNRTLTDIVKAKGHTYEKTVVEPTYTRGGYTKYTCSVCGDSYTTDQVAQLKRTSVASAEITVADQTYTGEALTPALTVKVGGKTLKADTDYTAAYENNTNVGAATVTIKGKGDYNGTATKTFAVKARKITKATVASSKVYTGKVIKPAVTVKYGKTVLKKGTDYTVNYKNNKKIGKATVTVKGKGNFTGTVTKTFKIVPKATKVSKVTNPKTKQLKVTIKKASNITGYEITYSTSKKFTKSATKTVSTKKLTKTIKKLTKGKTYYVKVRTYKTVGKVKYYSAYSKSLKVKVK